MAYVDVGDHRLWVERAGQGSPVVFSHGLFFDRRIFEQQVEHLRSRFETLNVDTRDHGRSDGPSERWSLWDATDELATAIDALTDEPVHFVGLSMGGMIGLRLALEHPEKIRSLTLMDTSANEEARRTLHTAMAWIVRLTGRLGARLLMPYAARKMFSPSFLDTPEAGGWSRRIAAMDPGSLFRGSMAVFTREAIDDRLFRIKVPTLVLQGAQDAATPRWHAERIAQEIPNAQLEMIGQAGHMVSIEQPDDVNELLDSFLRRVESGLVEATVPR